MKISVLLLFTVLNMCFSAESYSQRTKFNFSMRNATVKQVFNKIEKNSEFVFFYYNGAVDLNRRVTVSANNSDVSDILDEVFSGSDNGYSVNGRQITVFKKAPSSRHTSNATVSAASENKIRVSGMVYDETKTPMAGVIIKLEGSAATSSGVTDLDGHFVLNVPSKNSVLVFSYLGYREKKVKVGSTTDFIIQLEEDVSDINEVVVTGYGSQKKVSVVGAIENLAPSRLQGSSTRSLSNNLAGNVAGVIAVRRSGEPGYDNSSFWIRGISTFSGTTSPLVLVDGIERDLNNIDPTEIESFSVLKDASASAMYGVRGANGVIIINTKRGHIGAPSVDIRVEHSISEPTKLPSFIGGADYMELLNELTEDKTRLPYTQEQILKTRYHYDNDLYPDVNWIDEITKDYAYSTRANLDINGGSNFLRYSLVASVYNEQGIVERDKTLPFDTSIRLTRYNMRSNVDLDLTKTTTLRLNVGGYMQERIGPNYSIDDLFSHAFEMSPIDFPARYSDGTIPIITNRYNPWRDATQRGYKTEYHTQFQSLLSLEQNLNMITRGLKAKLTFSFDTYDESGRYRSYNPTIYLVATGRDDEGALLHDVLTYGDESLGSGISDMGYGTKNVYLEGTLTYSRKFGKHDVDALFLYNQQSKDTGSYQPYRKQGVAGRMSYVYDGRYVGEFNFGYNGSENFASGKRFGFFPSFALGWVVSEEPFMRKISNTINKLKIRASYGKVGNDNIGGRRFAYITTVNSSASGYSWGEDGEMSRTGITEGEIGVSNLTWETAWKSNLGVEIGLCRSLNLQFDVFNERRSNIFMQRQTIPSQTGYLTNPWANYGKVKNEGFEASLDYNKNVGRDWSIGARATFSYAKNKIIETDEAESVKGTYRGKTGRSMNTLWGLQALGLFTKDDFDADGNLKFGIPTQEVGSTKLRPGDIRYKDMDGDGIITDADEGYIGGTVDPRVVYGFGFTLRYKNFDFNAFFQGTADSHRIIGGSTYFLPGSGQGLLGNVYSNYNDRWTEDNQSQDVFWPRLSEGPNMNNYRASTWWKKDMSFLRCRTLELGYSLPKLICDYIHSKGIRFYVIGNNMFCFSKFNLWDPELGSSDGLKYPQMKSVMFGVDVKF